jgi:hypothetical protein
LTIAPEQYLRECKNQTAEKASQQAGNDCLSPIHHRPHVSPDPTTEEYSSIQIPGFEDTGGDDSSIRIPESNVGAHNDASDAIGLGMLADQRTNNAPPKPGLISTRLAKNGAAGLEQGCPHGPGGAPVHLNVISYRLRCAPTRLSG